MDDIKTKSENFRYLRDQTVSVLKWQVTWYFILLGFLMAEHGYFELTNDYQKFYNDIQVQEQALAKAISDSLELAKHKIAYARSEFERFVAAEDSKEARGRAIGLITQAIFLSVGFPLLIARIYKKITSLNYEEESITLIPKRIAILSSIALSLITFSIAFLVSWR